VLELLRSQGQMAILLVEQYLDFARALADRLAVMDRGQVVLSGRPDELDDQDVRRYLTV
jgi:urea transport system ATP-binding protein